MSWLARALVNVDPWAASGKGPASQPGLIVESPASVLS